jgi:heme/copper-type cytochrome/quinol oxidase subunit 2
MFSFRSDKTGFFVTIILLALLVGAVIGTVAVLALGSWEDHKAVLKLIWGVWWVLCIIVVLIRLAVFRWQMQKAEQARQQTSQVETPDAATPPLERPAPDSSRGPEPGSG